MDEEILELEQELARLRPRAVSMRLVGAVEKRMKTARTERVSRKLWWLALPVAAAVGAVLLGLENRSVSPRQSLASPATAPKISPAFNLVSAETILVNSRDEGLVTLADGTTARRLRETYLATLVWKNPRTAASFKWTVPRQEFRVQPVYLQ